MNRRQFTQRVAALATTPFVPATILPVLHIGQPYLWAAFIARIHDKASISMFKRHFSLTDEKATQVYNALVSDGTISPPNAQGISHAMNPFKRNFAASMVSAPQSAFKNKLKNELNQLIEEGPSEVLDDSEPVNPVSPECEHEPDILQNPADCVTKISP